MASVQEYLQGVLPRLQGAGGKLVRRLKIDKVIHGNPSGMALVMDFDSADAITGLFASEEYAALVPARDRGFTEMNILVTRDMLRHMKPRTVVMDLSIDMGGCFETSRPTSLASPTYEVDGILHMCVPNLPSVAARTATKAFTNATLPYLQTIAEQGIESAVKAHPDLARGILLYRGQCASETLARSFGVEWRPVPIEG